MRPITRATAALVAAAVLPALASPADAAAKPKLPKGTVTATIVKIVEGDVIDIRRAGRILRVRLLEVDTPARGKCWFTAATKQTASLLPVGKAVYLLRDKNPKDQNGRWLYHAFNAKGVHVNRNLVRYGYGKAVLDKSNDRYLGVMRAEQVKAKKEKLRVWSGKCDKPGSATPTSTPTPTPTKSSQPSGTDPRYRTCGDANAAGYGPYTRGRDPEYAWYQDRDGDGIVCER
jgi:micrococcal nuclease